MSALGQLLDAVEAKIDEALGKYNVLSRLEKLEAWIKDFENMDTPPDLRTPPVRKPAPATKKTAAPKPPASGGTDK